MALYGNGGIRVTKALPNIRAGGGVPVHASARRRIRCAGIAAFEKLTGGNRGLVKKRGRRITRRPSSHFADKLIGGNPYGPSAAGRAIDRVAPISDRAVIERWAPRTPNLRALFERRSSQSRTAQE